MAIARDLIRIPASRDERQAALQNAGVLANSGEGWDLARDLANSIAGRDLARDLADSEAGLDLARDLANSEAGLALARDLANSEAGQKLARDLANSEAGRALALALATSEAGLDLALGLANSEAGLDLALGLANSIAGLALALALANGEAGLDLALALANSEAGRDLALALANSGAGRVLALALANSKAGRALARDLANSGAGRVLALALANSEAGQKLARDLANSEAGQDLALGLANSEAGQDLALGLANSEAGQDLARELASSEAGQDLALALATSEAGLAPVVAVVGLLAPLMLQITGAGTASAAVVFAAAAWTLENDGDAPNEEQSASESDDRSMSVSSVEELYDVRHTARLEIAQADGIRARTEPFLGLIDRFLHDGAYPDHLEPRVERELGRLREELYDNVDEPLGAVVQAYLTSLLEVTLPLLDLSELISDAEEHGIDGDDLVGIVDAATTQPSSPDDVSPAVKIADNATVLVPEEEADTPESRLRWAAKVVGWVATTGTSGVGGAGTFGGVEKLVDLTFLSPEWAAVIGGCFGLAGAIAKIVNDNTGTEKTKTDKT